MYEKRYESMKIFSERLCKQMDFIMEIDKLKKIVRQSYISDASRKENDTEHSWSLAMMCVILSEYANESIDVLKTIKMVLIHDIIEIDAGDTYAYDTSGNATKKEREEKAANRLFNILPSDQAKEMRMLWDEFEEGSSSESKFANAVDKVQPIMLNDITSGKAWKEHEVRKSQVENRNAATKEGSQTLWQFCQNLIDENIIIGNIINDEKRFG